jgi:hypothetical protein
MTVPSSLAGKALDVFSGGAEQRKLRTICSVFPHNDNTNNANIWDVYGDAFGYLRSVFTEELYRVLTNNVIQPRCPVLEVCKEHH